MSMTVSVHCLHVIELPPNFLREACSPHSKETSAVPVLESAASPGGVVRCASARKKKMQDNMRNIMPACIILWYYSPFHHHPYFALGWQDRTGDTIVTDLLPRECPPCN